MKNFFNRWSLLRDWQNRRQRSTLSDLLSHADPDSTSAQRIIWFEDILLWLKKGLEEPNGVNVRLKYTFQTLEKNPAWKVNCQAVVRSLLSECSMSRLFLQTGFSIENGLFLEVLNRMFFRLIPEPPENDFYEIFSQVFSHEEEVRLLLEISDENWLQIQNFTNCLEVFLGNVDRSAQDALLILSANVCSSGLSREIRQRGAPYGVPDSPFVILNRRIFNICLMQNDLGSLETWSPILEEVSICRRVISRIYQQMEDRGVSVALVYKLETLKSSLDRIQNLVQIICAKDLSLKLTEIRSFFEKSIVHLIKRTSIKAHIKDQTYLLAKKIVERNGYSGENYVTKTMSEHKKLFFSAMGGGVIVVWITFNKMYFHSLGVPPLFEALGLWIIYSSGFLLMQFTGTTLATKMPSFLAAKLASQLSGCKPGDTATWFKSELKATVKSQLIGFSGNVMGLLPVVIGLGFLFQYAFSLPLVSHQTAEELLKGLQPLKSLVLPLAALTGVQLWLSGLAGGWLENWLVFKNLPEAIRRHRRINAVFGESASYKFSEWLLKNTSGIGGNLALGFLFGFVPFIGNSFGINLNSMHVTISTAGSAISFFNLNFSEIGYSFYITIALTLLLIGILNFTVSFAMAFAVALRALNIDPLTFWRSGNVKKRQAN